MAFMRDKTTRCKYSYWVNFIFSLWKKRHVRVHDEHDLEGIWLKHKTGAFAGIVDVLLSDFAWFKGYPDWFSLMLYCVLFIWNHIFCWTVNLSFALFWTSKGTVVQCVVLLSKGRNTCSLLLMENTTVAALETPPVIVCIVCYGIQMQI